MNELTISLDPHRKTPLYEQIYGFIREEIRGGRIRAGERLPSARALSGYLSVSRSTVDLAYEQLVSEGYLESVPCKGYFVCEIEGLYRLDEKKEETKEDDAAEQMPFRYDFAVTGTAPGGFPQNSWKKISKEVLLDADDSLFQLGDAKGEHGLREAIRDYLHHARGVNCRTEQIIVGAGNDYLLMLLRYVFEETITAAFENPTYPRAWKIFQLFAGEVVTVSSDASGICIEELEKSGAQVVYVMPSHQYPTGRMMPIGRRTELLNWAAREKERYIIEDDYDSEFRYRGKPVPSLQASDAAGKVIYMGTFSKSIAPAIRVGYMVLPEALLERYRQKCACFSCTVSRVDQAVLEQFLDSGAFERHLNRMRKSYSRKHEALLDGLKPFFRQFDLSGENAGLHLLLTDRVGRSEKELVDAARRQGVKVYGLSSALVGAAVPEAVCRATVLIGFGGLTEDEIRDGLERLAAAWLIEKRL